ncbi:MAG: hypothetical protein PHQ40_01970, partial [Anaerolineaceae bacterium]|nr:hypothetical protein [Anaerolineaceae bacterium]
LSNNSPLRVFSRIKEFSLAICRMSWIVSTEIFGFFSAIVANSKETTLEASEGVCPAEQCEELVSKSGYCGRADEARKDRDG